jgi:hypothetical protein
VGLFDAEDLPGLRLGEAAVFDDLVDLQRQARFKQLLLGMRQVEIGEDIATPLFPSSTSFGRREGREPCR